GCAPQPGRPRRPEWTHGPAAWQPCLLLHFIVTQSLRRAELAVARVAEARHDVTDVVEALVHRGHVDRHVRGGLAEPLDAPGGGDEPEIFDALTAQKLQDVHPRAGGSTGGLSRIGNTTQ